MTPIEAGAKAIRKTLNLCDCDNPKCHEDSELAARACIEAAIAAMGRETLLDLGADAGGLPMDEEPEGVRSAVSRALLGDPAVVSPSRNQQ